MECLTKPKKHLDPASAALIAGRYLFGGEEQKDLAKEYGKSQQSISSIAKNHESGDKYQRAIEAAGRYYESHPRPSGTGTTQKARRGRVKASELGSSATNADGDFKR